VSCEYLRPRPTVCRRQNLLSRQLETARGCQLKTLTSVLDMREDGFTRILHSRGTRQVSGSSPAAADLLRSRVTNRRSSCYPNFRLLEKGSPEKSHDQRTPRGDDSPLGGEGG